MGKEVYVRNPNFDVRKPVVAYRIRDDSVVPDIRINRIAKTPAELTEVLLNYYAININPVKQ